MNKRRLNVPSKMCRPPMAGENAHSAFVGGPNVAKVDTGGQLRGCHKALSPSGDGRPQMAPTAITRVPAIGAKIAKATWSGPLSKIVGLAVIHERGEGGEGVLLNPISKLKSRARWV